MVVLSQVLHRPDPEAAAVCTAHGCRSPRPQPLAAPLRPVTEGRVLTPRAGADVQGEQLAVARVAAGATTGAFYYEDSSRVSQGPFSSTSFWRGFHVHHIQARASRQEGRHAQAHALRTALSSSRSRSRRRPRQAPHGSSIRRQNRCLRGVGRIFRRLRRRASGRRGHAGHTALPLRAPALRAR